MRGPITQHKTRIWTGLAAAQKIVQASGTISVGKVFEVGSVDEAVVSLGLWSDLVAAMKGEAPPLHG
jgi:hypothetical protein